LVIYHWSSYISPKKGEQTMVKLPNCDSYGIKRLESKNAIIQM